MVQCDCLALYNFLAYDCFGYDGSDNGAAPTDTKRSTALLDVGCDQMHLVVGSPASVWFRSARFGGEQFTRTLARELHLTAAQAEELKRHPGRAESLHRMFAALEPAFESLVEDARGMLDAFAADHEKRRIERLLGCGGGFRLHGLLAYLRSGD
jgi:Tfp pilus assembly PilM family ATPase